MVQARATDGPKDRFEAGKADPRWLRRSIWDAQLPYFVQLVDQETLAQLSQAYSTLEAIPDMMHKNQITFEQYYVRVGWVIFISAESEMPFSVPSNISIGRKASSIPRIGQRACIATSLAGWAESHPGRDTDTPAVSTDNPETAASVKIGPISYRARCIEAGCQNLGRPVLIYADAGGRPIAHPVVCHAHGRRRLARDRTAGLKVFDDR
jgi:hypothetical protein